MWFSLLECAVLVSQVVHLVVVTIVIAVNKRRDRSEVGSTEGRAWPVLRVTESAEGTRASHQDYSCMDIHAFGGWFAHL